MAAKSTWQIPVLIREPLHLVAPLLTAFAANLAVLVAPLPVTLTV
jgi:hypothetical protein